MRARGAGRHLFSPSRVSAWHQQHPMSLAPAGPRLGVGTGKTPMLNSKAAHMNVLLDKHEINRRAYAKNDDRHIQGGVTPEHLSVVEREPVFMRVNSQPRGGGDAAFIFGPFNGALRLTDADEGKFSEQFRFAGIALNRINLGPGNVTTAGLPDGNIAVARRGPITARHTGYSAKEHALRAGDLVVIRPPRRDEQSSYQLANNTAAQSVGRLPRDRFVAITEPFRIGTAHAAFKEVEKIVFRGNSSANDSTGAQEAAKALGSFMRACRDNESSEPAVMRAFQSLYEAFSSLYASGRARVVGVALSSALPGDLYDLLLF